MSAPELMKMGELCAAAGVTPRTVRHYESERLVSAAATTPGGQKLYDSGAATAIRAVKTLQDIGMSIRDIRRLFTRADGPPPSDKRLTTRLRTVVKQVNADLERRIADLRAAQERVAAVVHSTDGCDACSGARCAECGSLSQLRTLGIR